MTVNDPEFRALAALSRIFVALGRELVERGEAPPARMHNAMVTAGLSEMVAAVGSAQVADWLRRQADNIETLDEEIPPAEARSLQ
jgi:hypothetical protein